MSVTLCLLLGWLLAPAQAPVRVELNHFVELNSFLLSQATITGPARPEYAPFVQVYGRHSADPPAVWQVVHDVSVNAADIAALAGRAKALPESDAARPLLEAMAGAWPIYEKHDRALRQGSLENAARELERRFTRKAEPLLMPELIDRLQLKPLEQPISIYPINRSPRPGGSGRSAHGFYVVLPISGQPILESLLHELTHVLDDNQPAGQNTVLSRIVAQARGVDPAGRDAFIHGLIMWNAREMVKRRVGPEGSSGFPASMTPYLKIYESRWGPYLDGTSNADQTIRGMLEDLARTSPSTTSPPPSSR
ncbi:MAG: hypothetical protein ACREAA_03470 [Candidatus Polarisedimenticolia bacterium]